MNGRTLTVSDNLAVIAGKLSAGAIRALGAGLGSNLPGRLARKVSPGVLARLSRQRRRGVLAVSGTNGKSTTAGFLNSILTAAGWKTVHNRQGANLVTGITATLVDAAGWDGSLDADYCLFEVDEASLPVVAAEVPFSAVLVTNLFRDQLDRFGELDTTYRLIDRGISINRSDAVLNADDPNVAQLASASARLFYGIESLAAKESAPAAAAAELSYCGGCGSGFVYERVFYGQLGHYRCPSCSAGRPRPDVAAAAVVVEPSGSRFILQLGAERLEVSIGLPGLFNVYNAVAAAAMAWHLSLPAAVIRDGLASYTTLFGRSERLEMAGRPVVIQLIKNPAGASQVVATVVRDDKARLLIAINDNLADGRDVSWLWDADFEQLCAYEKELVVSGQRAYDMALRMKYAGLPAGRIEVIPDLAEALDHALDAAVAGETLWLLPTYTCLLELQKILKGRGYSLSGT